MTDILSSQKPEGTDLSGPKHIVVIAHFAGSERHGMVFGHYYLAREWVKLGHHVTVIAAGFAHTRQIQPVLSGRLTEESIQGIRYLWLKTPEYCAESRLGRIRNLVSFAFQVWALPLPISRADLVVCSSHCPFAVHGSHRIARRFRARMIFEVRDLWPLTLIELGGASRLNPIILAMQWSEDMAYRVCDKVISVLPAASGYMQSRGMPLRKFSYVPNGISFDTTEPPSSESLATASEVIEDLRDRGKFIIGYAGRFVPAGTLACLLRAVSICANDKLHLFLLGDGYLRLELESLCGSLGLTERVTFFGVVDKALVIPILAKLDALYLGLVRKPIFRFGVSPTKLNDYFMAARPVIYAVDAPEDPVALSGGGISCKAENVHSIAAAIRQISSMSPADRDRMGILGRNWLLSNRTYDRLASKFLEVAFSDV